MQDCAVPCSRLLSPLVAKLFVVVVAVALVSFVSFVPFVAKLPLNCVLSGNVYSRSQKSRTFEESI